MSYNGQSKKSQRRFVYSAVAAMPRRRNTELYTVRVADIPRRISHFARLSVPLKFLRYTEHRCRVPDSRLILRSDILRARER